MSAAKRARLASDNIADLQIRNTPEEAADSRDFFAHLANFERAAEPEPEPEPVASEREWEVAFLDAAEQCHALHEATRATLPDLASTDLALLEVDPACKLSEVQEELLTTRDELRIITSSAALLADEMRDRPDLTHGQALTMCADLFQDRPLESDGRPAEGVVALVMPLDANARFLAVYEMQLSAADKGRTRELHEARQALHEARRACKPRERIESLEAEMQRAMTEIGSLGVTLRTHYITTCACRFPRPIDPNANQ